MRALTVWRPWGYAFCYLGKRVENREWEPPRYLLGREIGLHSGRQWDGGAYQTLRTYYPDLPTDSEHPVGMVAVARLARIARSPLELDEDQRVRWWVGPVGLVLADLVVLPEPIPCRGYQKFWYVDRAIQERIEEQLGRRVRGG